MKKILIIASILMVVACQKQTPPKDYAIVQGTITNPIDSLQLRLYDAKNDKTVMVAVAKDGTFLDTLRMEEPTLFTAVYKNAFGLFVANDMDLKIEVDTEKFSESLKFTGKGEAENNFLKFKAAEDNKLYGEDYKDYYNLEQDAFDKKTKSYLDGIGTTLKSKKSELDSSFVSNQELNLVAFEKDNLIAYQEQQKVNKALAPGNQSPEFTDYMNYAGGKSSLKDFRGSYVYIDVWATWCGPCKYEIPFLAKVEEQYHGKNIKFISLSIDNLKDEAKWRTMIKDKKMGGIQLLADKDYESQFVQDYFIYGIPRFILIDPAGKIINYDAPRPSEEKLKTILNGLAI
ncbi:TlpA family protein disulfide reductase [Flavobacterium ardleyense]|uniref:TlpA family protein disulfide reductase n=1 Tax=Flavobacterium ardleyense TaxID=2038737 RepID=A0ABW5Z450_9FLAO